MTAPAEAEQLFDQFGDISLIVVDPIYTDRFRRAYKQHAESLYELACCAAEVRSRYSYSAYIAWLRDNFDLSRQFGDNLLNIHGLIVTLKFSVDEIRYFDVSALHVLAAPSVPNSARQEAAERAANGEKISYSLGVSIRDTHLAQQPSTMAMRLQTVSVTPVVESAPAAAEVVGEEVHPEQSTRPSYNPAAPTKPGYDPDAWCTPPDICERVRQVLGGIDIDPASSVFANGNVKAARYYTVNDDGLNYNWPGRVFLNPPYSIALVRAFTEKLLQQYQAGITTAAILLVNNASDAYWCQPFLQKCPVCFTRGRLSFLHEERAGAQAMLGQSLFYLGPDPAKFREVFGQIGVVLPPGRLFDAAFALDEVQP